MRENRARADLLPFARWLREQMRARRLTTNALGLKIGVSGSGVSEWARALRRPRLETLRKMAATLDTPLEEIEALLPSDEAVLGDDVTSGTMPGAVRAAVIPDWMRDPDLVVLFYGLSSDLTQEELDSIKPIVWREYLRVKSRRGESVEGGDPTGDGPAP